MPDDLDRAVDARIDAYRPDVTPPFEAIQARKRRRSLGRLAGAATAIAVVGVAAASFSIPGLGERNAKRSERLAPVAAPASDGRGGPLTEAGGAASTAAFIEQCAPGEQWDLVPEFLGLREDGLQDRLGAGAELRVLGRDGQCLLRTDDVRPERVNVLVEDGLVVWAARS